MTPRLYAPALAELPVGSLAEGAQSQVPGLMVPLPDEESHHAAHVLRLRPGADVRVFDGRGREWAGRVEFADRRRVRVELVSTATPLPEWRVAVTLAQALLKGDRMDAVIRDATMMGAAAVQPLVTAHVAVPARAAGSSRLLDRWRRVAVAAAKQCGRAVVPEISAPVPWEEQLRQAGTAILLALVEPRARAGAIWSVEDLAEAARVRGALVAVGPEGGWSAGELEAMADAGWRQWSLGDLTLRADAVPVAALAVLRYAWREAPDGGGDTCLESA